jgi:hypothetical protein
MSDYLTRDDLLGLGIDPDEADAVLALSDLTGHDGEPCVEAARLDDLLGLVTLEGEEELLDPSDYSDDDRARRQ